MNKDVIQIIGCYQSTNVGMIKLKLETSDVEIIALWGQKMNYNI